MPSTQQATAAPLVDEVLVEYIKLNPGKRPFPGAPAPRLSFKSHTAQAITKGVSNALRQTKPAQATTTEVDSTQTSDSDDYEFHKEMPSGVSITDRRPDLMAIMRNALVVNPGTGAVEPKEAKKGNVDGAHDSPDSKLGFSSRSSLNESSHGLPDGAHDQDDHLDHGLGFQSEPIVPPDIHRSQAGLRVPQKTVLKHSDIESDAPRDLLNPGRKMHEMHVRIVTPKMGL